MAGFFRRSVAARRRGSKAMTGGLIVPQADGQTKEPPSWLHCLTCLASVLAMAGAQDGTGRPPEHDGLNRQRGQDRACGQPAADGPEGADGADRQDRSEISRPQVGGYLGSPAAARPCWRVQGSA